MKKSKKKFFIIRLKDAIFNFDEYKNFATEKTWTAIKYALKLILLVSFVLSITINMKIVKIAEKMINTFIEKGPEFSFVENNLVIDGENKYYIDGYDNIVGIIINSEANYYFTDS